ncbi:probable leucine-rich repeat receptor-like protein kinase At1g35710 [Salvia miltiorrhiza]|uniref:probable leucine-rich repeat receptor-like protein kinase At1g35710 n=1 Tax=Salvia miltiorrhiza TaxID=226208 RepID=UPI0025AD220C|nr:probable leucine-rich repeat receptor-like protein kinase At1g35710 [Salvia miltiorrhiza]
MGLSLLNLEQLYLNWNSLSGNIPTSITNASKLTNLAMNANSFSGSIPMFGNLRLLQSIRIWGNNLTGAEFPTQELEFLSSLTNCRFLREFDISNNPLNGILPSSIGNFSSSFQAFAAYRSSINGVIPQEIGNLSGLLQITLSRNKLIGSLPATLGQLKKLQRLYAHTNQLEGFIPHDLCRMSSLGELNLSSNVLVGPIPECLGELQYLKIVYLSSNNLSSTVPSSFWNLRDIVRLDLSSNNFSGQLPSQVGNLEAAPYLICHLITFLVRFQA